MRRQSSGTLKARRPTVTIKQARNSEAQCADEMNRLKKDGRLSITRIRSHKTDSSFVRAALRYADFSQSISYQGDWPDEDSEWRTQDRIALAQNLIGTETLVEAVSFFWGGKPRMTLRLRFAESDRDTRLTFFISDMAAAQAQAGEFEAIAKSAKAPIAKRASAARL